MTEISNNSEVINITGGDSEDISIIQQPIALSVNDTPVNISNDERSITISNNSAENIISNNTQKVNILVGVQGLAGPSGKWVYKNQIIDLILTDANSYTIFQNENATGVINITIDASTVTPGNPWSFRILNVSGMIITITNGSLYAGNQLIGNSIISANELISTLTIEAQSGNMIAVTELEGNWNYEIS